MPYDYVVAGRFDTPRSAPPRFLYFVCVVLGHTDSDVVYILRLHLPPCILFEYSVHLRVRSPSRTWPSHAESLQLRYRTPGRESARLCAERNAQMATTRTD
jgi:hypothetical protein